MGQRRRRSSASAFEPAPPAPIRRSDLVAAARRHDGDVESPMSVEQHVGVDQELRTIKSENQEVKSENQEIKSENQEIKSEFQEIKRQLEALQKIIMKKSPATKRKSFRRFETSDGGSAYYQNEESGETLWDLPEGADVHVVE